ncbi:nitrilase-related carbon-nitrogen hydrolase [Armatimonas sp.]|uniref:nitrilase-related carbon-nitrogen hydrolase n=1 Tax=Armatimonas sp. TaxID=1872638 RepID=UPI00286A767B|nr:nitrilase-related carbon-nitrogen hydrolase [Armatimonas sp.]
MKPIRIALAQTAWEPGQMERKFLALAHEAQKRGAALLCLPEFALSPYFALRPRGMGEEPTPEAIPGGMSCRFFSELARESALFVQGSLLEEGFDTSVVFAPDGALIGACRKQHIPADIGYYERDYFGPGDSDYPVFTLPEIALAAPTCYDQWFPELARIFALKGAELIAYPTAIGSEPSEPGFDSQPAWTTILRSHAIANGVFIAATNRIGIEESITFYGSSVIVAPGGEVLAQASRDNEELVVADLDPAALTLWRRLFPLLERREPQTYGRLLQP